MSTIQHIIEPSRLYLAWQAPEGGDRSRHLVGELNKIDGIVNFRYLIGSADLLKAQSLGFKGFPVFKISEKVYEDGVIDAFMRRLPPSTRGDFRVYLNQYCLPIDVKLSELTLLGYTGAKLPTDGFSIVNPFDKVNPPCELLLEVAGFRYTKARTSAEIQVGKEAVLLAEPSNPVDPKAISLQVAGSVIGYIPRGMTSTFHRWMEAGYTISAKIERINGTETRPLLFVFVEVRQ